MTTQDMYSWAQMVLQVLVGGGVMVGVYRYYGVLKRLIEGQEKTIAAQAEQMKAQSTVLQDFERLNKVMQQVIDMVDAPAMIQRWQSYRALVDQHSTEQYQARVTHVTRIAAKTVGEMLGEQAAQFVILMANTMPFIPPVKRSALIEATELLPIWKQSLQTFAKEAPYQPIDASLPSLWAAGQLLLSNAEPRSQTRSHP
jgi:hypothetical protein